MARGFVLDGPAALHALGAQERRAARIVRPADARQETGGAQQRVDRARLRGAAVSTRILGRYGACSTFSYV